LHQIIENHVFNTISSCGCRKTDLENLAEAIAAASDTSVESTLKILRQREQQRAPTRKIKLISGKVNTGSTTMVTVIGHNGKSIDFTSKAEVKMPSSGAIKKDSPNPFTRLSIPSP